MEFEYIFGPVRSSRLGLSLGLELLGDRICDFDCLYCEVGKTFRHTAQRDIYVPSEKVLNELGSWFEMSNSSPEYITLGGMGEPCLNIDMGKIISGVKAMRPGTEVAVLTNSSLMSDPQVREELSRADAVLPSLDTVVEEEFKRLNRPCEGLRLSEILQGLLDFRGEFNGKIFMEILLVPGFNDSRENLQGLQEFCARFSPERIDLTRMSRPGAYIRAPRSIAGVEDKWRAALGIGHPKGETAGEIPKREENLDVEPEAILASLRRRPQTISQISSALGTDLQGTRAAVERLQKNGMLRETRDLNSSEIFFTVR